MIFFSYVDILKQVLRFIFEIKYDIHDKYVLNYS
jgi:hypothetical protein